MSSKDSSMVIEKKGIVTILGSDSQLNKAASSLRRTLSADMSSKKWLAQNGISPMKRIASSHELSAVVADHSSSSSDGEDELDRKPTNVSWSSILLSGKPNDDSSNNGPPPPPYIHPLTKKPATLNEKSLEICTENLGSETGSEGFSSYPHSETSDVEEEADKEEVVEQQIHEIEEFPVAKYNYTSCKKLLPPRAFPPPLPSIASKDGPSVQMQSHRENGRLVLEAVSMPQMNYFHTERQEGRLRLSLTSTCQEEETEEDAIEEFEEVFDNIEGLEKNDDTLADEDDEEEEAVEDEEEIAFVMEQSSISPSNVINVHKSGLIMKRLMKLDNNDPTWSNKLNKAVKFMEHLTPFPQSSTVARVQIPSPSPSPRPPQTAAASASFNVYEYFWKNQPKETSIIDSVTEQCKPVKDNKIKNLKAYEQQEVVVMKGNKPGYLIPLLCKDNRRSLLVWEPRYIATS